MRSHTMRRMSDRRYRRACGYRPAPQRADPAVNPARAAAEAKLDAEEAAWREAQAGGRPPAA